VSVVDLQAKLLSVVTAVSPDSADFLESAWNSLLEQQLPAGWKLEWIVQTDGTEPDLKGLIASITANDGRVRLDAASKNGAPTARNLALGRVRGELLMNLDADDEYEPASLATLVATIEADKSLGWVAGRTVYSRDDGTTDAYSERFIPERIERGRLADDWLEHDHPLVHPSAAVVRTNLWSAFGGWMALSGSEDTGTLLAISEYWPGQAVDQLVLRYRKWPGQTTASAQWRAEKSAHYRTIARRLGAIRALRGTAGT
jgi:glycosyltransferase involved in cell wall biosynthesis